MTAKLTNDVRQILTLLAGFVIGMHVAVFLHEFGHALGYWLDGGTVERIVMESPLPAGHVDGTAPGDFMHVWGGVAFGSVITVAPMLVAWWTGRRSRVRFAAIMIASFCLGHNAMYLFVGSIVPFADAANMITLGAPRWLLLVLGVPLLIGFVAVLTPAIQMVGLSATESVWKWIVVAELGLLTLPALMVASMLFMPVPQGHRLPTVTFVACYAVCFCIAAQRAHAANAIRNSTIENAHLTQRWSTPLAMIVAAVVLVVVEWFAFGAA